MHSDSPIEVGIGILEISQERYSVKGEVHHVLVRGDVEQDT